MATILISGGTGLIGTALSKFLTGRQHEVIILSRQQHAGNVHVSYSSWNPSLQTIDTAAIQRADYIINLAGADVADKRWTKKRKKELIDSRVQSGQLLVKALQETPNKVKAVISMSGIGWYGDDKNRNNGQPFFKEEDTAGDDFLSRVCVAWEEAIQPVTMLGKRLVIFRTGIVLSNEGGAFIAFKKPVQAGLATIFGNGRQTLSWIHIDDLCRLMLYVIENEKVQGVYNAVSPQVVTNKDFMLDLAKKIKGRFFIPFYVPSFLLKMAVGEVSIEVLKSASVSGEKVKRAGFQFIFPTLQAALDDLVKQ